MSASIKNTATDVNRNTSPSGKNNALPLPGNSDSTAEESCCTLPSMGKRDVKYTPVVDSLESLPPNSFKQQAHNIDLDVFIKCNEQEGVVELRNAVATTLQLVSAEMLRSFFSPTVHTFKVIFKGDPDSKRLVIWRKGIEVFIGTFVHHATMQSFGFEHVAGLLIGYDGSWYLKTTVCNAFASTKWTEVWKGDFECYGGVAKMVVDKNELAMQRRASMLADSLLVGRFWECKADVKAT